MRIRRISRRAAPAIVLALASGQVLVPAATPGRWVATGPDGVTTVLSIAADPSHPSTVYAGTRGGGAFRSDDGGDTWIGISDGTLSPDIRTLAVDATDPGSVWAGTGDGLYRGLDQGLRWEPVPSFRRVAVDAVAFDPRSASNIYAASTDAGVFRSSDAGATWVVSGTGLLGTEPVSFGFDRSSGAVILACRQGGVFRSFDRGVSWTPANAGLTTTHTLSVAAAQGGAVFVGKLEGEVFKSADGGTNWTSSSSGLPLFPVGSIAVDPSSPDVVLAVTAAGLFRSADAGGVWRFVPGSSRYTGVIVAHPSAPGVLFAGAADPPLAPGGFFRSTDHGLTWPRFSMRGMRNLGAGSFARTPSGIYAGLSAGLRRTTDHGNTWQLLRPTGAFTSLVVDPSNPNRLYLGSPFGLSVSDDGGVTVRNAITGLTDPNTHALAIDPVETGTLYLGNDAGLNRSTDGAGLWSPASSPPNRGPRDPVIAIAIDPGSHRTVYAATSTEIYKTVNGSITWFSVGSGIPSSSNFLSLLVDASAPGTVYAGTTTGVYKTTQGGGSWSPARSGIENARVISLKIDPDRGVIYAGTDSGVYSSEDGGATWISAGTGLVNPIVTALELDGDGELLAGTEGAGVFLLIPALEVRDPLAPPASRRPRPKVVPRLPF